jgi:N-acetylglucosaminyldiphosphoundecaprenol N-acetyl-beta-D-mannosaminyltransferase
MTEALTAAGGGSDILLDIEQIWLGGLPIARLSLAATADLMIAAAKSRATRDRPLVMTSANGEVISRCRNDRAIADLFTDADLISADGQPLVFASRFVSARPLSERVATSDLFHVVARRAEQDGVSFYLFGSTEEENRLACERVGMLYPRLAIAGRSHGYLEGKALERCVAEINDAKPGILWVALGVPREQVFCATFASSLRDVGVIKTSGGLFNFLSGSRARAPAYLQRICLEWAFRLLQEPRRLFVRYALTNPHAAYLLARSGSLVPDRDNGQRATR